MTEYYKTYYQKNREKILAQVKAYQEKNPDKVKAWKHKFDLKGNPRRLLFNGKRIHLKENPRTGVCSQCGKEGLTHMHHVKYDLVDPLKNAVELCPTCHAVESNKSRKC